MVKHFCHTPRCVLPMALYSNNVNLSYYIYLFISKQRGRERGRETSMCGYLSHALIGGLSHNPGMFPNWESKWWPFGLQAGAQSTELHQPGRVVPLLMLLNLIIYGDNSHISTIEMLFALRLISSVFQWKNFLALIGVAQLVEHHPTKWGVSSSIPIQGTCLGCGPIPSWDNARSNWWMLSLTHWYFLPSLYPSLPLSLKK